MQGRADAHVENECVSIEVELPSALGVALLKDGSHFAVNTKIIISLGRAAANLSGKPLPPDVNAVWQQLRGVVSGQQIVSGGAGGSHSGGSTGTTPPMVSSG